MMRGLSTVRSRIRAVRPTGRDERGATLILVLVFVVVGGLLVGALLQLSGNDLVNSVHFKSARNQQTDARAAINEAIQSIRYAPLLTSSVTTLNASPPVACWQDTPSPPPGGYTSTYVDNSDDTTIAVWCSTAWYPSSSATRVVTFSACPSSESATACAAQPLMQAAVTFDDYPSGDTTAPSDVACVTYCGTDMTVDSFVSRPTVPTVTSVGLTGGGQCPTTTPTGPVTGGTAITICGSGFVLNGTTVSFVEEHGGVPVSDNTVCSSNSSLDPPCTVTSVSVGSASEITADAPEVTEGSTYFVTVTTPGGTSAYSNNGTLNVFTYTVGTPSIASILPSTGGETAGGTLVTITGSDFVTGSTVSFVEESGDNIVKVNNAPVSVAASYTSPVTLNGNQTQIEVVAPSIYAGSSLSYFVEVELPSGVYTATSSNDVFMYSVTTPTVSQVSVGGSPASEAASGSAGQTLTVYGTSFYTGETVVFDEEENGSNSPQGTAFSGSNVNVLSASKLTVTVPTPTSGSTFFVNVTTPSPCSGSAFCTSTNQAVTFSYVPTITLINPTTNPAGSTITISGSYFASDAGEPTVSFLEESGGNSLASPPVTVVSPTVTGTYSSLTATVPQISAGTTYFVTVTTPGGVSWTSNSPYPPVFTYAAPTVTQVTPASSATQNQTIQVTGTDFYTSGTTVNFVLVASPHTVVAGSNVTVTSSTRLSVNAPSLTAGAEYYVEVVTPSGTSSGTPSSEYEYT